VEQIWETSLAAAVQAVEETQVIQRVRLELLVKVTPVLLAPDTENLAVAVAVRVALELAVI
jgi:hypothetical protein